MKVMLINAMAALQVFIQRIRKLLLVTRNKGPVGALQMTGLFLKSRFLQTTFSFWENAGIHLTPVHFYEPIPDRRELRQSKTLWEKESALVGIDMNVSNQLALVCEVFPSFKDEYRFPSKKTPVPFEFYLDNGNFGTVDAEVAHCMVRYFLPRKIIEIGSGYSTYLLARACRLNQEVAGIETELSSVDPYPNEVVAQGFPGLKDLRKIKAEDIEPGSFLQLQKSDILFIDSSHVVRTGGDVNYLFLEILPRLNPGVVIHIHDIFLPREYPKEWVTNFHRSWSEQYLLQAFLIGNPGYKVLWSSSYMHLHNPQELKAAFDSYDGLKWPSSFWMRKAG
jgi:predicted O-methyltransferase YrrM